MKNNEKWFKIVDKWWEVERNGYKVEECGGILHKGEGERMFIGEYSHSIDAKGRLIVPAKLREQLGEEFVVTKGLDGRCLSVYPMEEWKNLEQKIRSLPLSNADGRTLARYLMAGAVSCELDKQGRILLPAVLREFAQLEKDVVLAGVLDRVEIWNKEKWASQWSDEKTGEEDIGAVLERLEEHGIQL